MIVYFAKGSLLSVHISILLGSRNKICVYIYNYHDITVIFEHLNATTKGNVGRRT